MALPNKQVGPFSPQLVFSLYEVYSLAVHH
jgi:hypothetical protein